MAYIVENFNPSTGNASSSLAFGSELFHDGVRDVDAGDFEVTANGTDLEISIAGGTAFVDNDAYASGGTETEFWKVRSDSTVTVTLDTADATNARKDLIVLRVDDAASSSARGVDAVSVEKVTGTPAASPSEPTPTYSDYIVLAMIDVPANDTAIAQSQVEDRRLEATPIVKSGGWITQQRLAPTYQAATTIRFTSVDVDRLFPVGTKIRLKQGGAYKYFYVTASTFSTHTDITITGGTDYTLTNAAITHFAIAYGVAEGFPDWFSYTPTLGASGSMTYTSTSIVYFKFKIEDNFVHIVGSVTGTTGGSASTSLTFTAPSSLTPTNTGFGDVTMDALVTDTTRQAGFATWNNSSVAFFVRKTGEGNYGLGSGKIFTLDGRYEF